MCGIPDTTIPDTTIPHTTIPDIAIPDTANYCTHDTTHSVLLTKLC